MLYQFGNRVSGLGQTPSELLYILAQTIERFHCTRLY